MIHPNAIISKRAEISETVKIGGYAVIDGSVKVATGCEIAPHAQIIGDVEIGKNCFIGQNAVIGGEPQSRSFDSKTQSGVRIGEDNILREFVTIHRSTLPDKFTQVGDDNLFMCGVHLGHDVKVGSHNNFANNVMFGGFVEVGDNCFIGGASVFHQFIRLGNFCMIQGMSAFSQDVPTYAIGRGRNNLSGINLIGMRRAKFSREIIREIKNIYARIYVKHEKPVEVFDSLKSQSITSEIKNFIDFFQNPSRKGICMKYGDKGN